jgi:hypothetical protein
MHERGYVLAGVLLSELAQLRAAQARTSQDRNFEKP